MFSFSMAYDLDLLRELATRHVERPGTPGVRSRRQVRRGRTYAQ